MLALPEEAVLKGRKARRTARYGKCGYGKRAYRVVQFARIFALFLLILGRFLLFKNPVKYDANI